MISVRTGTGRILIGKQLLPQTGKRCRALGLFGRCAVISDTNVAALSSDRVKQSLAAADFQSTLITIPAGEKSKTLEQAGAICDQMIASGLDRQSFIVGLGGGVVGDISGFVAAIYHRGIPHVQVPTTLLAMADSSIGGKTGVNTAAGKNLIGTVHHPSLVIDDLDVLKTLPKREVQYTPPPGIEFLPMRVHAAAQPVQVSMDREALVPLPSLHRADVAVQVRRDFLPGVKWSFGIGRVRCRE